MTCRSERSYWVMRAQGLLRAALAAALVLAFAACGGGPSAEEVDRSMREFTLAASLREEGNIPGALERLRVALDLDPDNARAHLLLGYIHLERRDFPKAEQALSKGIALLSEREDMAATLAEAKNVLGVVLIEQERYDEAIPLLRESASDMLNHAPWYAWGNLGWAYYEKGEYAQAQEALEQAVRVQPRFCLGHYQLGRALFAMEQYEEAEAALTDALEADERCERFYQDAWALRGETRARLGQREDAIADFERCIELGVDTEAGETCERFLTTTAP